MLCNFKLGPAGTADLLNARNGYSFIGCLSLGFIAENYGQAGIYVCQCTHLRNPLFVSVNSDAVF